VDDSCESCSKLHEAFDDEGGSGDDLYRKTKGLKSTAVVQQLMKHDENIKMASKPVELRGSAKSSYGEHFDQDFLTYFGISLEAVESKDVGQLVEEVYIEAAKVKAKMGKKSEPVLVRMERTLKNLAQHFREDDVDFPMLPLQSNDIKHVLSECGITLEP